MAAHRTKLQTVQGKIVRAQKTKLTPERVQQNACFIAWLDDCVKAADLSYDWSSQARTWSRAVRRAVVAGGVELITNAPHASYTKRSLN